MFWSSFKVGAAYSEFEIILISLEKYSQSRYVSKKTYCINVELKNRTW